MIKLKIALPILIIIIILFSYYSYYYSKVTKFNTPELAANAILSAIKNNKIEEIRFATCGETPNISTNKELDDGLQKYWLRIQQLDWSQASFKNPQSLLGEVEFINVYHQGYITRYPEKIYITANCHRHGLINPQYGFTPTN